MTFYHLIASLKHAGTPLSTSSKQSSFKYFFTAEKETEESNVISQELFIYWLVERAV